MSNKKFTAVEKLEIILLGIISFDSEELRTKYKERIAIAKELEKQQIIDAYKNGKYESDLVVMSDDFYAEQYYNKTFKK